MKIYSIVVIAALLLPAAHNARAGLAEDLAGRGMWVNAPAKFDTAQVSFLQSIGVRRVHLMLTNDITPYRDCSSATAPKQIVSAEKMARAIGIATDAGLKVFATSYIPPSKDVIDRMVHTNSLLGRAIAASDLAGVEYDIEGQWVKAKVCGFANHRAAVDYLVARTRALRPSLAVGVTVHYGRLTSAEIAIEKFDWISAQAYSKCPLLQCAEHRADVRRPPKGAVAPLKSYRRAVSSAWDNPDNQPGTMQRNVARRLGTGKQIVVLGLPAYSQFWNSNHTVTEAMQLAHEAAADLGVQDARYVGVNYWALSSVLKPTSRPEITKFLLESAAKTPVAMMPPP
ncbi:MAG: hypothetical protein V4723_07310 [Pseudomonadota bacterium]